MADATWEQTEGDKVTLTKAGEVLFDGDLVFVIDAAGRLFDDDHDPFALVESDGTISGTENEMLGRVGLRNASPPWSEVAWLHVAIDGTVLVFGADGGPVNVGVWRGCDGPAIRTCTLISHLFVLEAMRRRAYVPDYPMMVGTGVWY
jgi:hypothetical protein